MSLCQRLILSFAGPYAGGAGWASESGGFETRLRSRLAALPWWARLLAAAIALLARWLAPAVFLGRPCRFENLTDDQRDALLARLQFCRPLALRGAFLLLESLVLPASYGEANYLEGIGFVFPRKL